MKPIKKSLKQVKNRLERFKPLINGKVGKNFIWNLAGGFSAGIVVLFVTPFYVKLVGVEGYGVLSIWFILLMLMGLLDLGFGATIIKEFAQKTTAPDHSFYQSELLKTYERVYIIISIFIVLLVSLASFYYANEIIKSNLVGNPEKKYVFFLMGLTVAAQFPFTLYINSFGGLQDHATMNKLIIASNLLRHFIGLLVLFLSKDFFLFFTIQFFFALSITILTRKLIWNKLKAYQKVVFNPQIIKELWKYSLGMALTSIAAILLTNADRIILTKMVSTKDLGLYSLSVSAASIIQFPIQAFYKTFFPKYSELIKLGDDNKIRQVYMQSCEYLAWLIYPITFVGFIYAEYLFSNWLGVSDSTMIVTFRILLISGCIVGLGWLPAAFQQAFGWPSLHLSMMSLCVLLGIPVIIFAVGSFGIVGATAIWIVHSILFLTLELKLMHTKILTNDLVIWYFKVFLRPALFNGFIFIVFYLVYVEFFDFLSPFYIILFSGFVYFCLLYLFLSFTKALPKFSVS